MATLQAATTSNGAVVTDPERVRRLCESYCFGTLKWDVDDNGRFSLWGYDAFEAYEQRENSLPDYEGGERTEEFLRELASYIATDETLDIQTAGFTKCRFPVLASRCVGRRTEAQGRGSDTS